MMASTYGNARWLFLVVFCVGLGVVPVQAASLGVVHVKSKLYEPFHAHIPLRKVRDFDALRISMADEAVFDDAGLERPFVLSKFKFRVIGTGSNRGYINVSSHERIREPALSFVIEAAFSRGVQRRRYDVLLDLD